MHVLPKNFVLTFFVNGSKMPKFPALKHVISLEGVRMKAIYCKIKRYNLTIKGKRKYRIMSQPVNERLSNLNPSFILITPVTYMYS